MSRLVIIGAGGHGRSVAEAVLLSHEFTLGGFVDDSWSGTSFVWEYPVFGNTADPALCRRYCDSVIVAIGNNVVRARLQKRWVEAGMHIATIIHPKAMVSPRATIGAGSTIMAGAVVGTEAVLGTGVIVNCGAVVDHHCRIGDFAHWESMPAWRVGSILGEAAWMQAGVSLGYRVKIPPGEVIGPGESQSG